MRFLEPDWASLSNTQAHSATLTITGWRRFITQNFLLEHLNLGYLPAPRAHAFTETPTLFMTGWSAGPILVCHASLSGHSVLVAGLGFSVPGNPGSDVDFLLPTRTPDALKRVWVTVSPAGEEKEYIAICRHLLPWMKVAVRSAKQDVG
jgi:hypothetical protein